MAVFYDRTNSASGGSFYDRSNSADSNTASITCQNSNLTASGITYQTVTATAAITDYTSIFYNLGYTVVNGGTRASLPTQWTGSTITLAADGSFTVSPALPNGTVMPRRHFNSITSTWNQDNITLLNGMGTGFLGLSSVGVSGVGSLGANRVIRRTLVNKLGAPIAQGTQIRAIVTSGMAPGFTTYFNGTVVVGSGGQLDISSDSLPAIGTYVILTLYAQGVSVSGDDDNGMAPRRVQVAALT